MQAIALITNCPKCGRDLTYVNYMTSGVREIRELRIALDLLA